MAEVNFVRFARALEDQAYVAVGFGVLGFQKAQAYRVAWQRRVSRPGRSARAGYRPPRPPSAAERFGPLVQGVAGLAAQRLRPLISDAAERVAPLLSDAAERVAPLVSDAAERVAPLVSDAAERVAPLVSDAAERVAPLLSDAAERVAPLVSDAAERVAPLVSEAAEQLRPEAQEFLRAAGDLMNDLPGEARELAKEAVAFGRLALQAFRPPPPPPPPPNRTTS